MKLSSIFSDGMVLQHSEIVTIFGKTKPTHSVSLTFLEKSYKATSDNNGKFSIELDKLEPGGPYQMKIIADEKTIIKDILIGDV